MLMSKLRGMDWPYTFAPRRCCSSSFAKLRFQFSGATGL
jgi:hypothetical protein